MRIDILDVGKRFGDFVALDEVSMEVCEGSLTALLGPSGSGKSTLLRIIAGLEAPDTGSVQLDGGDVTRARPQDRGIGFVFQHYAPFNHMSVRDNVAFGLRIRKRPKAQIKARVDELLALVGLTAWAGQRPSQLSGGQRQRMALARALAVDPRVLLLDEPFGALDAQTRESLQDELVRIWQGAAIGSTTTAVFVTHDVREAVLLADRVVVFSRAPGQVVADIRIELPRPRSSEIRRSRPFAQYEEQILGALFGREAG